ncbi:hypothetical protein HJC23_007358 [Cyclotella cryptica]|uniref:Calmodulin n=1 Tax=Cyclotella cryptica TaxID=29204 RepID=A0ABD3Q4L3_9STRA|eukprot:CCRYP_008672-RB/>CCRYP_008672-RB protein AED:0.03 eAED:0.03 QI:262/1/1/1/1/0.92/14/1186/2549
MTSAAKSNEDDSATTAVKSGNSSGINSASSVAKIHSGSLSGLGDACGVAFLLGNHSKFGLAERCCYHFDLIETLTSMPAHKTQHTKANESSDRGDSSSSREGRLMKYGSTGTNYSKEENLPESSMSSSHESTSSNDSQKFCYCGVVSLLECTPSSTGESRSSKRALRSKHREFNTRAQKAWGRMHRRNGGSGSKKPIKSAGDTNEGHGATAVVHHCHQPRHLPLPLNPNTRVTFAYELTSIAIVIDASPSATAATFDNASINDGCCVALDRLGSMLRTYLKGLIQPIELPPVSVTGLGIAFGRWTPHLAITVVAAYPPTPRGDRGSAGLLVRDFRVVDEQTALELVREVEKWALHEVEDLIAERLSGERSHSGDGLGGRKSQGVLAQNGFIASSKISSWTSVRSSMKDMLAIGDAALATLPPEGRPVILVASDCLNVHCGGVFEHLAETSRFDVPVSVLRLSSVTSFSDTLRTVSYSPFPLGVSDDSKSVRDVSQLSGGIFLDISALDVYANMTAGSPVSTSSSPFYGDIHFTSKKRSIRPNALQWYSLFTMSPLTPGYTLQPPPRPINLHNTSTIQHSSSIFSSNGSVSTKHHQMQDSLSTFAGITPLLSNQSFDTTKPVGPTSNVEVSFSTQAAALNERTMFSKYNINPVRIKSLLMTRILEGYRARRYGQNTQDPDKVSIHMTLKLADCGAVLHYEVSFVSSPYHMPMIGSAHIKLELSGDDPDFISLVKRTFISQHGQDSVLQQGRRVCAVSKAAADRICKLLRWIRKEDYLDSYLCLPGWGDIDHFAKGSSFLRRIESLSMLQRHRHFRSEAVEVVAIRGSKHENHDRGFALFSDLMMNHEGEDNLYEAISDWASGIIAERQIYFKIVSPAVDDDLTYYLIIHVVRCHEASRLFTITIDFHGELDAEQRLGVVASFRNILTKYPNIVVLDKKITNVIALRPESRRSTWIPKYAEYFLHHRSWNIVKDPEVIPLITKRRSQIGNFMVIHSEENRALFVKFVNGNVVVYQVLSRQDGIFVDIHMESHRALFTPFHAKESTFYSIYEKVKKKDMMCAENLHSRTNLLQALDHRVENESNQAEDVLRLINISSRTERRLRFFHDAMSSANTILFQLTSEYMTSGSLKSQTAKLSIQSAGDFFGNWFVMRVDWYVLTAIHFSANLIEDSNGAYQQLTLFTAGITDLYPSDDDAAKAAASSDDYEDPYGIDLVINEIDHAHRKNYAIALFQSLRHPKAPISNVQNEEVNYAMNACSFKKVLREFISLDDLSDQLSSNSETMTGIKLCELIEALLSPLPGSDGKVFYFNGDYKPDGDVSEESCDEPMDSGSLNSNDEDDVNVKGSDQNRLSRQSDDGESDIYSVGGGERDSLEDRPPLFFRLTLDGDAATQHHIRSLKKSSTLEASVSIFDNKKMLPPMHIAVISKLRRALNSFVVEQSLEKYRFLGDSLSQEDLSAIMSILPKTNHRSVNISLSFFVPKTNRLIPASNPTGSTENDLEHGYSTLSTQLQDRCAFKASNDSFLTLDETSFNNVLPYWCFVQIVRALGVIEIKVYHPSGDEAAETVIQRAREMVISMCHRTNQLLMLEDLYRTRNATSLLIAEDPVTLTDEENGEADAASESTSDNNEPFSCPIQYRKPMALNHRCAPKQAIDSLISSTLHNFLLSNRRRIFVFKDESDNIFYMKLCENLQTIELCVFGLSFPGPSITEQLVCLLQKKILMLPLEILTSVLKKNPYYSLLPADVAFIRGFSDDMSKLDHDSENFLGKSRRLYALPSHVQDPLVILLLFRQNITGSSFIHHLYESSEETNVLKMSDILNDSEDGNIKLCIPPSEFIFYFNSSPSQLDPSYQPLTTLTEKGKQFSRQAGSGIAIIEISLLHGGRPGNVFNIVGKHENSTCKKMNISKSDISLTRLQEDEVSSSFTISVDIINTTVDIEILHQWVELSLSQVLIAWSIERHMYISRNEPAAGEFKAHEAREKEHPTKTDNQRLEVWKLVPDFPAFEDMMRIASELPHPAIVTATQQKMIRTTSLATLTLQMNEMILGVLCQKAKMNFVPGVSIIRCSNTASIVVIKRNAKSKNSIQIESRSGTKIRDRAMESPEYISVFGLGLFDQSSVINVSQLFFKETFCLRPTQETSTFSQALSIIKKRWPALFTRHLAFILRVSKSCRTLFAYNMHPQVWINIKTRFFDIDNAISTTDETHRTNLQLKCSGQPSLYTDRSDTSPKQHSSVDSNKREKINPTKEEPSVQRGPTRRIPRPTSMLRPKLIGKSVEGSAMQAVTASRLRASSRPNPPQRTVLSSAKSPTVTAQKDKERNKAAPKKKRELIAKDVPKTSGSGVGPPTSQTRYLRDISPYIDRPKLNQSSSQSMLQTFLRLAQKESDSKLILTFLLSTCYGSYLGSWSECMFACDNNEQTVMSFFSFVRKHFITGNVVRCGESIHHDGCQSLPHIFALNDLVSSPLYRATIMLRVSMEWDTRRSVHVFTCRAWLVNSSNLSENIISVPTYLRQRQLDRKGAVIEALVNDFVVSSKCCMLLYYYIYRFLPVSLLLTYF